MVRFSRFRTSATKCAAEIKTRRPEDTRLHSWGNIIFNIAYFRHGCGIRSSNHFRNFHESAPESSTNFPAREMGKEGQTSFNDIG
jgi:hypothetical protein